MLSRRDRRWKEPMIQAVGIDVVDLDRFDRTIARWGDRFIDKILTPREIAL
ncbi:4'-phosphopantetheinyl transferase superfamily protein, partial [candidate division KSB1 bacterium]|nr:4'-phosphopantetheinyl transferase superfamily protein [candidate division KSB1 bacterium]